MALRKIFEKVIQFLYNDFYSHFFHFAKYTLINVAMKVAACARARIFLIKCSWVRKLEIFWKANQKTYQSFFMGLPVSFKFTDVTEKVLTFFNQIN